MLTADSSRARISGARWITFSITAHRATVHSRHDSLMPMRWGGDIGGQNTRVTTGGTRLCFISCA